jgi:hypothetical protein
MTRPRAPRRSRARRALVVALALTLTAGCSGVTGDPFTASPADGASTGDDGADAGAVAPGHAQVLADAGAADVTLDAAAGPISDGSAAREDGHVAAVDAALPGADASAVVVAIACGDGTALACAHPPDVCCVAYGTAARSCVPAAACAGTAIACAGPSDCPPAQTCCGAYNRAGKRYDAVTCAPTCARSDDAGFDVAFCALRHGDADCPAGQRCIPSMVYAGFAVCG